MTISQSASAANLAARLQIVELSGGEAAVPGADVIAGLAQPPRSLPPRYFYDDAGSALFEQICALDEYYLTRTETAILRRYAGEIVERLGPCELVELGSGSATKIRILLDQMRRRGWQQRFLPIDVSAGILIASAGALLADYPDLRVYGLVGTFEQGMAQLPPTELASRMLCFLGSTLGNLTPDECQVFFAQVAAALARGEYFLLGVDLHKDTPTLEAAYDDAQGITARFNLNMLAHLNWRFGGNFDLTQFRHVAFYNEPARQIEIYLESLVDQTVRLEKLNLFFTLAAGERIHTEISRKFEMSVLGETLAAQGLPPVQHWNDPAGRFAVILCQKT